RWGVVQRELSVVAPRGEHFAVGCKGEAIGRNVPYAPDLPTRGHVPQTDRVVVNGRCRGDGLAVGSEGYRQDRVGVPAELSHFPARGRVPEADELIIAPGCQRLTVGRVGDCVGPPA